jgi:hypothetical protein
VTAVHAGQVCDSRASCTSRVSDTCRVKCDSASNDSWANGANSAGGDDALSE